MSVSVTATSPSKAKRKSRRRSVATASFSYFGPMQPVEQPVEIVAQHRTELLVVNSPTVYFTENKQEFLASLPDDSGLKVMKPIPLAVERHGTSDFVAKIVGLMVAGSGATAREAKGMLIDALVGRYFQLKGIPKEKRGALPTRQFHFLEQYLAEAEPTEWVQI